MPYYDILHLILTEKVNIIFWGMIIIEWNECEKNSKYYS